MATNQEEIVNSTAAKRMKTDDNVVNENGTKTQMEKSETEKPSEFKFAADVSLEDLRQVNEKFIKDRSWHQFHSPRNVLLALVGEVGELSEIFQWKGEVSEGLPELSQDEREHVGQELSDVLIYLIDLAARCQIDLPTAALAKMAANAKKYPVDKVFGKSNKYTDYQK